MRSLAILVLVAAILPVTPNVALAEHEITRWRYGHTAAVSVTFDDALYTQVAVGAPLLEERNLLGTFYVLTGDDWNEWEGYWDDWREVAAAGHEIGSHTVTHAQLSTLSEQEMREELEQSRETIDAEIPGQTCRTIAYPYGDYDDFVEEVTADYYIAARSV